jgi:hypothetical protein
MIRSICGAALIAALLCSTALAQNLSGTWKGNVTCNGQYVEPQPWPLTIVVTGSNGHYTLTANTPNSAGAGTINGNKVEFTESIMGLNTAHNIGTVVGNRMSGTYVQGGSGPCTWFATALAIADKKYAPHTPTGHCLRECEAACIKLHKLCMDTVPDKVECTRSYGRCRERCPAVCKGERGVDQYPKVTPAPRPTLTPLGGGIGR